jgi:hypothetical protein
VKRAIFTWLLLLASTHTVQAQRAFPVDEYLSVELKRCMKSPVMDSQGYIYSGTTGWEDRPDNYTCYKVAVLPDRYGVLSLQTGPSIERYRILAIEFVDTGGGLASMKPAKVFKDQRVIRQKQAQGLVMVFDPSPRKRYFVVITHKIGSGAGRTMMNFDHVWPPGVVMWAIGSTLSMQALSGAIASDLGLEGWEAEVGEVVIQQAMGALSDDTETSTQDDIAGWAATALPHLDDRIPSLAPSMIFKIYRSMKTAFLVGLTRKEGDWILR